jgi:hypothetical protein
MKKITSGKKSNSRNRSQKYASKFLRKKINKNDDFAIWLVDGASLRKNVNENFVEYGDNNLFDFIPKNQLWIDQDLDPKEYHYFIERFVYENELLSSGVSYVIAEKISDVFEKKERQNSQEIKKAIKNGHAKKELLPKIKKRLLKKYSGSVKVWLVDEGLVRAFYLIDYCEGGHDKVYSFIPKNEIWIEQAISPVERKFIILHELHERHLMMQGKSYKNAHLGATEIEDFYRENPNENIDLRIKEEMKKNDDLNQ